MAKQIKTKEEKEEALRKILEPFAQWVYDDIKIARNVIDKYFKQKSIN